MLEMTLNSSSGLRGDDSPDIIVAVSKNHVDHLLVFNFITDNWATLKIS